MLTLLAIILGFLVLAGLPLFIGIFAASFLGYAASQIAFSAIPIEIFRLGTSPVLLAIPLYTLAGFLLSEGGTSQRLVRFSRSVLGWVPGGLALVALLTCAFFTAVTGATGVTIIALGGLLMPALLQERYSQPFALGLLTVSGSMGLHFPPSLPVILYGFVSGVSIEQLFAAGMLPGVVLLLPIALFSVFLGKRWHREPRAPFVPAECLRAFREAAWELVIPFGILAAIYAGIATATEIASLTVAYVFVIKIAIFNELNPWRDLPRVMKACGRMLGGILIVIAAALSFTNYLVDAFIPMKILSLFSSHLTSKWAFLLLLNLFLLLVGCIMDIFSAILVVVPLIAPLAAQFDISPLHLGVIFLANLGIGYNTPPVGLNLFIASSRFERPITQVYRATLPFLALSLLALILIVFWPGLSLWLPAWLKL